MRTLRTVSDGSHRGGPHLPVAESALGYTARANRILYRLVTPAPDSVLSHEIIEASLLQSLVMFVDLAADCPIAESTLKTLGGGCYNSDGLELQAMTKLKGLKLQITAKFNGLGTPSHCKLSI
jgi:hypothetical protein